MELEILLDTVNCPSSKPGESKTILIKKILDHKFFIPPEGVYGKSNIFIKNWVLRNSYL
jgi:hypothetical protein